MKDAEREDYLTKVSEISQQIDDEISRREQAAEADAEGAEDQMKTRMGKEAGLSDADIGKLKNMGQSERGGTGGARRRDDGWKNTICPWRKSKS